jgi:hypothetical protein
MSLVRLSKKSLDIELLPLSRIKGTDALIDFGAQGAQFFDMRKQSPPDLFLIGIGQVRDFLEG